MFIMYIWEPAGGPKRLKLLLTLSQSKCLSIWTAATEDKCEMEILFISEDNNVIQQRDREHHWQKKRMIRQKKKKKREEGGKRESAHGWRRVGVECIGPAKCESSPAEHMRELRSAMTGMWEWDIIKRGEQPSRPHTVTNTTGTHSNNSCLIILTDWLHTSLIKTTSQLQGEDRNHYCVFLSPSRWPLWRGSTSKISLHIETLIPSSNPDRNRNKLQTHRQILKLFCKTSRLTVWGCVYSLHWIQIASDM